MQTLIGTSIGYHTLQLSMSLTQEDAGALLMDFKAFRDKTGEIEIIKESYPKDPFGRHLKIIYLKQDGTEYRKGIGWRIRFSNKGSYSYDEYKPCSIKAVINPKILAGEQTYIVAANASNLSDIERLFNEEAAKISPKLGQLKDYTLNRLDYCINFDIAELYPDCPPDLMAKLPELLMALIKCGDIPDHYIEKYNDPNQFYLKSESVHINCYWKHHDLLTNFPGCPDLDKSQNIIRFEVQYKYPKVYTEMRNAILSNRKIHGLTVKEKEKLMDAFTALGKQFPILNGERLRAIETMLSEEECFETINDYFERIVKRGDYYSFNHARKLIESKVYSGEKAIRLTNVLQLIREVGGIAKAKATLHGAELEEFRRSLRELAGLRINPVTIPDEWGIDCISNLLDSYYNKAEAERNERFWDQEFKKYIKDCKKHGKPWLP